MPLTPASVGDRSRLNLSPVKVDAEGRVDPAELDGFTRTVHEWGKRVDQRLDGHDTRMDTEETDVNALLADLETRLAVLEEADQIEAIALTDVACSQGVAFTINVNSFPDRQWVRKTRSGLFQAQMQLVITSAGTAGSVISIGLPFTLKSTGLITGSGWFIDNGTTVYNVTVFPQSTTSFILQADQFNGRFGVLPNFGVVNGDQAFLSLQGQYAQ